MIKSMIICSFSDWSVGIELQWVAVCCSVLQCVAVCCSVLQCIAVCCSVLQCVAVWCSVLQCDWATGIEYNDIVYYHADTICSHSK